MRIQVFPIGILRDRLPEKVCEVPDRMTVGEWIGTLSLPERFKPAVWVNGKRAEPETVLHDQDQIRIVSRLTGG
jgi:sulfur carrier protein ThiS